MDVEKFVRHLCRLVLRHQMPVWNYFVNSFYSVQGATAKVTVIQISAAAAPHRVQQQNDTLIVFPPTGW